jgi:hypothetical protein
LPHKAAAPAVRHRGSYGPLSDSCTAAKNVAIRSPHRQSQAICLGW